MQKLTPMLQPLPRLKWHEQDGGGGGGNNWGSGKLARNLALNVLGLAIYMLLSGGGGGGLGFGGGGGGGGIGRGAGRGRGEILGGAGVLKKKKI